MDKPSFIKSYKGHIANKVHIRGYIDIPYGDLYIDEFVFSVNKDIYYLYDTGSEVEIEYEEHFNKLFGITTYSLYSIKNTGKNKYEGIETWLKEEPYEEEELVLLNKMNKLHKHYGFGIFWAVILSSFVFLIVKLFLKESVPNYYWFIGVGLLFLFLTVVIASESRRSMLQVIQKGKKKVIKIRIEEHGIERGADHSGPPHNYIIGTYGTDNTKIRIAHQNYLYAKKYSHLIFHLTVDNMLLAIYDIDLNLVFKKNK